MDKIIAGIASIPVRETALRKVIMTLHKQVDVIELSLNDYKKIPLWITKYPKVNAQLTTNQKGDANKFLGVAKHEKGIYFSCDDDILYPINYVKKYLTHIKRGILTIHGSIVRSPVKSYYQGRQLLAHCLQESAEDRQVTVGGTGVMAFDLEYFRPDYDRFTHANMADVFIALQAHEQKKKIIALAHRKNWIRLARRGQGDTIFDKHRNDDSVQTQLINQLFS